jgi:uncharacterized protein (TIRG00374 family)
VTKIRSDLLKFLLGFTLAALLIVWVLRGSDPREILAHLREASLPAILGAVILNLGHNVFRVWRWRALLEPVRPGLPFRPMFTAVILGYMTTWVIPGRVGELVRPMLLSESEGLPLGPCIGSVVADRVLDAATVVGLFAVGTWITPLSGRAAENAALIRSGSLTLLIGAALLVIVMLGASAARRSLEAWLGRRGRLVGWLGRTLLAVSSGAEALRSPRLLARTLIHSALAWLTISAATWLSIWAAGVRISPGAVLIILPLLVLGVAVPTPGGAGSYHGAMKVGLVAFGVGGSLAVSAAVVAHLIVTVPVILLGLFLVWLEKVSWKKLVDAARRFKELGALTGPAATKETVEGLS